MQLVELPKGDWAFTIVRQFLFDAAERVRLEALAGSQYEPLAAAAAKLRNEELYHFRHSHAWLQRLGLGTAESHRRMQNALDEIWPYRSQLFAPLPAEALLVDAGYVTEPSQLRTQWHDLIIPNLQQADLILPENGTAVPGRDEHTQHLVDLLKDMQVVARLDPQAEW